MRITKYGHACVRIEVDGRALVVDPGVWTDGDAVTGADAVLITHEHADHVDPAKLAAGVPVYAPAGAQLDGVEAVRVEAGEVFTAAGFTIRAVGGRHATIYGDQPDCANLGYVVDGVYHPGDSLHMPDQPIDTLLVPVHGSWMKLDEAIDLVKAVRPARSIAIHDAQLNERGLASVNGWLGRTTDGYSYLEPGTTL